jgi:eukaryotic-like serine/threonine-protein kinase
VTRGGNTPGRPLSAGSEPRGGAVSNAEAETMLPDGEAPTTTGQRITRGTTLGRYVVIDVVGRGGMGVVVSAYDPELDRKVAIKLLRWTDADAPSASRGAARLLREAQALAKVAHTNVVAVHDVGTVEIEGGAPSVFVAMELLDGEPVADWLVRERPGWREVLAVFIAAARGLEAAHAAGVVHRDFKPENVRLTGSGRVVVLDFGLARASRDADTERSDSGRSAAILDPRLTLSGAVMGTPAFMSPEQAAGQELDAATDQFSFCVSLYLGLYGELPFRGESGLIARATWDGELPPARTSARVPKWLRPVLARGLARDPAARHPGMTELIAALERDPSRRWRTFALVSAVLAAIAVSWWGSSQLAARRDPCEQAAAEIDASWTPARRDAVIAALGDGGDEAYPRRVAGAIDRYADELRERRLAACEADRSGEPGAREDAVVRIACLDRARGHLDALLGLLEQPGEGRVAVALPAVTALPAPSECTDAGALRRSTPVPSDPTLASEVAQLRFELTAAKSIFNTGDAEGSHAALGPLLARARALGFEPLLAEALVDAAWTSLNVAAFDESIALAEEGYLLAEAHGVDVVASTALTVLTIVRTYSRADPELAEWHSRQQEAIVQRLGNPPGRYSRVFADRARLLKAQGDLVGAIALLERADGILADAGIEDSDRVATLDNLGAAYSLAGRSDEALRRFEQALSIAELALGPGHNLRVNVLVHLGQEHWRLGHHGRSIVLMRAALAGARATYNNAHPNLMAVLNSAALVELELDVPHALELLEEAVAVGTRQGEVPSQVRSNLARALVAAGRFERAAEIHRALIAELDRPEQPASDRAYWHNELGDDLLAAGAWRDALREHELASTTLTQATPPLPPSGRARVGAARARLELGDVAAALIDARVGLAATEQDLDQPYRLALARYTLARALRSNRREPELQRALVLAAHRAWAVDMIGSRRELAACLAFVLGANPPL